jgi:transcriptional regulator with XRE-family HTH domain
MSSKKSPSPVDVHVGSQVRRARMLIRMSQETLGNALGLTFQQVQKYEKGTNRIGASRLQQIAMVLGRPVSWFFDGLPTVEDGALALTIPSGAVEPDPCAVLGTTREGITLARAFNAIHDSKLRYAIVHMVETTAAVSDREFVARKAA